VVNNYRTHS